MVGICAEGNDRECEEGPANGVMMGADMIPIHLDASHRSRWWPREHPEAFLKMGAAEEGK